MTERGTGITPVSESRKLRLTLTDLASRWRKSLSFGLKLLIRAVSANQKPQDQRDQADPKTAFMRVAAGWSAPGRVPPTCCLTGPM